MFKFTLRDRAMITVLRIAKVDSTIGGLERNLALYTDTQVFETCSLYHPI